MRNIKELSVQFRSRGRAKKPAGGKNRGRCTGKGALRRMSSRKKTTK